MQVISKTIIGTIEWSEGRTKKELAKQTFWSSSKDFSGLSGLEVKAHTFNNHVGCTAITSQGLSQHKYFQIPVDKIEEFCNSLMEAKKFVESKNNEKV
tara:strand:+ start:4516 stop:4809 length:294 start_codon:yes stop_codon:yes gene_type:complete